MIKRICPKCLTPWYSADTTDSIWICQKCGTKISKSKEISSENEKEIRK